MRSLLKTDRRGLFIGCTLAFKVLIGPPTEAQSNLPPTVQADLLRDQINAEAKANDSDAVLRSIDQYKELRIEFPTPMLRIEAKAAHDSGDAKRAVRALGDFLAKTDRGSEQYKEALALYPQYQKEVAAANSIQEDAERATLAAKARDIVASLKADLVKIPGGDLATDNDHVLITKYRTQRYAGARAKIKGFSITKHVISSFAWHVFLADAGRGSDDGLGPDVSGTSDFVPTFVGLTRDPKLFGGQKTIVLPRLAENSAALADWMSTKTGQHWHLPSESQMAYIAQREAGHGTPFKNNWASLPTNGKPNYTESLEESHGNELLSDCWHADPTGAPSDGSAWTTSCAGEGPVFVTFEYREVAWDVKCGIAPLFGLPPNCHGMRGLDVYLQRNPYSYISYLDESSCDASSRCRLVTSIRLRLVRED